jgi:hypothetical protein
VLNAGSLKAGAFYAPTMKMTRKSPIGTILLDHGIKEIPSRAKKNLKGEKAPETDRNQP